MQRFILVLLILINLYCVQNKIFIKEVYLKSENLSEEAKQTLKYKKIERCYSQKLFWGLGGEFRAVDYYDKAVAAILEEAFRISNQNPWYDVEIYRDNLSCVSLTGYYDEKK